MSEVSPFKSLNRIPSKLPKHQSHFDWNPMIFLMFWRFLFHIHHIWFPPKILDVPGISPFFLAQETFKKVLSEVDIAISTAAIPGRRHLKFFRQPPKWPPNRPKLVELDAKIFHKWWRTILFCIFFDEVVGWYGVNGYQQTSDDMMTWIWLGWRWDLILYRRI